MKKIIYASVCFSLLMFSCTKESLVSPLKNEVNNSQSIFEYDNNTPIEEVENLLTAAGVKAKTGGKVKVVGGIFDITTIDDNLIGCIALNGICAILVFDEKNNSVNKSGIIVLPSSNPKNPKVIKAQILEPNKELRDYSHAIEIPFIRE